MVIPARDPGLQAETRREEQGKRRHRGGTKAVSSTPVHSCQSRADGRIIGSLGTFPMGSRHLFVVVVVKTELIKSHGPGRFFLNRGGKLFFISHVVYVKGYS